MAELSWFFEIENKVFTRVQYNLKKKHSELHCTTKNENFSSETGLPNVFPTLYLHMLPSAEVGKDIEGSSINAVLSGIEIDVYTNTTESECKQIINDAVLAMKSMRFSVIAFPVTVTRNGVSQSIARFRRVVGSEDTL